MVSQEQNTRQGNKKGFRTWLQKLLAGIPLIGWLFGLLAAVLIEYFLGDLISYYLGLPKIPVLFGFITVLKKPLLMPGTIGYLVLVYGLPILLIAKSLRKPANKLAAFLDKGPVSVGAVIHLGLFYGAMHFWTDLSDYRLLVLKLTMIAIMLTLSINVINGYMGELLPCCFSPMTSCLETPCFLKLLAFIFSHWR
jgi:branched-chain amino acid transport system permease protein